MKIQILPNWCKKLGLALFIIASVLNGGLNFINNSIYKYNSHGINISEQQLQSDNNGFLALLSAFTGGVFNVDFIAIMSMLIYMISKEKVEDDYIDKLRLESFQLTFIIGLLATIAVYLLNKDIKLTLDYFIFPLLWCYIAIFLIKRKLYL
ncbi:hypothetical protein ABI125_04005 [Tamlana crocina]